jgi:hypothetical protein
MKLIYQWMIVIALALVVFSIRVYGGNGCSKPQVAPVAAAVKNLHQPVVKSKSLDMIHHKVPKKRTRKHKARKIDIKLCKEMAEHIKWATDDPDWYFCEASPKEETLKSNMKL